MVLISFTNLLKVNMTFAEAKKDIGHYLMDYYNCYRPHQNNGGVAPTVAEEKPNLLSWNS